MKLKKALTTLSLALLVLGMGSVQAADLRVGVEGAYPPFSWKESDGTLKGFDIEIAEEICAACATDQVEIRGKGAVTEKKYLAGQDVPSNGEVVVADADAKVVEQQAREIRQRLISAWQGHNMDVVVALANVNGFRSDVHNQFAAVHTAQNRLRWRGGR